MSEYTPIEKWHPTINEFDINDIVEGGSTGIDNIPHQQLADNLLHLSLKMKLLEDTVSFIIPALLPTLPVVPPVVGTTGPEENPLGEWVIDTPPSNNHYWGWNGVIGISATHSSGKKVKGVVLSTDQIRTVDNMSMGGGTGVATDTDDQGRIRLFSFPRDRLDASPNMVFTITAPNTTTFSKKYYVWDGVPYSYNPNGGAGGNANQTE